MNRNGDAAAVPAQIVTLDQALAASREQIAEHYKAHVNPVVYNLLRLVGSDTRFVRAQGVQVWDDQGNEYLDFLGGYGSLNLGHNHPELVAAVEQVASAPNFLQTSVNGLAAALARTLAVVTPGPLSKSFFCSSGTEAVESAIKLARASTGRPVIVSAEGGFHGKTMGALAITPKEKYQKPFAPMMPETRTVPYGDLEALEKALHERDCAAFIVEPIQGEGGIIIPPRGHLKEAERLCRAHGTLFVADEIQTGLGRTGTLFASEQEGLEPDIMTLAKSLGGGVMPLGACIASDAVWQKAYGTQDTALLHTSTFGGNTRAMAAGLKTIEILVRDGLPENAEAMGNRLLGGLALARERGSLVRDVRGRGLLVGIEFQTPALGGKYGKEYLAALFAGILLRDHRIITAFSLNNPTVMRLEPPLTVSAEQIDRVCTAINETVARTKRPMGVVMSTGKYVAGQQLRRVLPFRRGAG